MTQPAEQLKQDTVEVTYNGVDKKVRFQPHEVMQALLAQAVHDFSITVNPHVMA
jgi:hypothetical protein